MEFNRKIAFIGAVIAALSVGIGAFGAHALKDLLETTQRTETYETAVRYQFFHAIALLVLAASGSALNMVQNEMKRVAFCFILGITVFSGSLYILCLSGIRWLGAITPIGGVAFIVGWLLWALAMYRPAKQNQS